MATNSDLEMLLRRSISLLHSPHSNSAVELRQLLDEEIRKRYGAEKLLTNRMTKKQIEKEMNFPGRVVTPPPRQTIDDVINLTHSPAKTISDSDSDMGSDDAASITGDLLTTSSADVETNLKDFGDLNCCVCGEIMFTATNRLIECSKCGALYHQECHKPPIKDNDAVEDQANNWQCHSCIKNSTTSKVSTVIIIPDDPVPVLQDVTPPINQTISPAASSESPSSSNSSSPFYKMDVNTIPKPITKLAKDSSCSPSGSKSTINSTKMYLPTSSSSSLASSTKPSKHHDKRKSNK